MAKLSFCCLFLSFCLYMTFTADSAATPNLTSSDFIKASCNATLYPALCVRCLSRYANVIRRSERQLAIAALCVSLNWARSTVMFVSRMANSSGLEPRVHQAVSDCIQNMGDSVYQLGQSVPEFGHLGLRMNSQDFTWHVSNVQTWVSAALTDENTCVDGFSGQTMGGNVKTAIKNRINYIAQITSIALALVNHFAARHKAGEITNVP